MKFGRHLTILLHRITFGMTFVYFYLSTVTARANYISREKILIKNVYGFLLGRFHIHTFILQPSFFPTVFNFLSRFPGKSSSAGCVPGSSATDFSRGAES